MGLGLLTPLALLGLLTLALPLLIHLRRQVDRQPVDFAALRWLQARLRPRSRWRLERPWLLLLRLLLAALLALLLASPVWQSLRRTDALLLHPALDPALLSPADAANARWWAPGFPAIDEPAPAPVLASISLLRQFDAQRAPGQGLQVWLPDSVEAADAELPQWSRVIDWQVQPGVEAEATESPPRPRFWWHGDASAAAGWWLAALQALAEPTGEASSVARIELQTETLPTLPVRPGDTLIWASDEPLSADLQDWLQQGGQLWQTAPCEDCSAPSEWTALWRSDDGRRSLWQRRVGQGRALRFDAPVNAADFPEWLQPEFPQWLLQWSRPLVEPTRLPAALLAGDGAVAPARSLPQLESLQGWLSLLIALLWLLERAMAGPRRSTGAAA